MTAPILVSPASYAEYEPSLNWQAATPLSEAMRAAVAPITEAVHVVVNHGRWVVQCPDCAGAQLGCATDHRFMCNECANISIGGLWRPVVWPERFHDLAEILAARTDRSLQNWEVGETAEDLTRQNEQIALAKQRGIPPGSMAAALALAEQQPEPVASEWEDHTHRWPKKVEFDQVYECRECGLPVPGSAILAARAPAEGEEKP